MIKLIVTDFDGCLVDFDNEPFHSSWDAIGLLLEDKKRKKWFDIREKYWSLIELAKTIEEKNNIETNWFNAALVILKDVREDFLKDRLFPLPYTSGAREFFLRMKEQGKITGILSSGVDFIIEKAKEDLGMDFVVCNKIHKNGKFFTGVGEKIIHLFSKHLCLLELCKKFGISSDDVCYFGDHSNCVPCLRAVGLGIAVNAKTDEVIRSSKANIKDFREAFEIIKKFEEEKS